MGSDPMIKTPFMPVKGGVDTLAQLEFLQQYDFELER
jgi:hypothetical protein